MLLKLIILFLEALKATKSYKLRSFLSIISIALGLTGVTLVTGSIYGAKVKIYELLDQFGSDAILIIGGSQTMGFFKRLKSLTFDDATALKQAFPTAYIVAPMDTSRNIKISYIGKHLQSSIIGSTEDYSISWNSQIEDGRDLNKDDIKEHLKSCILGSYTKEKLFDKNGAVGKNILLSNFYCNVVGILEEKGVSGHGQNINDRLILPISTMSKLLTSENKYVSFIKIRFSDPSNLRERELEIKKFLRMRHNIQSGTDDDFIMISPHEILKFFMTIAGSLIIFLGIITVLSIIVGGFVVANLFLISVQERTSEIGIRRTFGAKKQDIFIQFIFEFLILSMTGAIFGYFLGFIASNFLKKSDVFTVYISTEVFFIAVVTSVMIAIIFGFAPAKNASDIEPIKAIREL
mgnify:CR=1 FL=1